MNVARWIATATLLGAGVTAVAGCQTLSPRSEAIEPIVASTPEASPDGEPENPVVQVSAESEASLTERAQDNATRVMNFVTGKEQEDVQRAKQLYQEGDRLFRLGESQKLDEAKSTFRKAAKQFRKAAEAAPDTALQQDALFMQAESLFFADRLMDSVDTYQKLQKDYPRNRHIDRVAARLFTISRYWIEYDKASGGGWYRVNLTDRSRPRLDLDGHAVRVLDQIRYDDPTGRLADDATMAAAAEYIRQQRFEEADEFLTDLRETFSDSEHLFLAHLLGIRCKLESYAGPAYSGLILEEAEKLIKQTRQRFPDKLADPKYGDMVARASAEAAYHRADRLAYRADYRYKRKEYGAARFYYHQILRDHPDTPHADDARKLLEEVESYPAIPTRRLSWLTKIFPDSRRSKPLQTTQPLDERPSETKLR